MKKFMSLFIVAALLGGIVATGCGKGEETPAAGTETTGGAPKDGGAAPKEGGTQAPPVTEGGAAPESK